MKKRNENTSQKFAVSTKELAEMLSVGKDTARKIGKESGARVKIGSRVVFRLDRVMEHLNKLS